MTQTSTPQQKMAVTLAKAGIPHKRIECYGSQIVITSHCRETAEKWHHLLAKFATPKGIVECLDEAVVNRNTVLRPTMVKVWRTYATI